MYEDCDLDRFVEAIKGRPYHEVLTKTLKEGYASDDRLVPRNRDGSSEEDIRRVYEYNKALKDFLFLLQVGVRPEHGSERERKNYNKFRQVAENLVAKGELVSRILEFFDG
jgi:hypothetical protein